MWTVVANMMKCRTAK